MYSEILDFKKIIYATKYSINGIICCWKNERAFKQEIICFIPLVIISFFLDITKYEHLALILSLTSILIVELINSAIEKTVDRISTEKHLLSGQAKDMASASVMLALINAILVWFFVLVI